MPEVLQILGAYYGKLISNLGTWTKGQNILENNVMIIDRIAGDHVSLREGNTME